MKISLIHATRGRPEKCIEARNLFLNRATNPSEVEHIFVVDSDDRESIAAVSRFRHEIADATKGMAGCVRANNLGASVATGDLLMNMDDDLVPPTGWDESIRASAEPVAGEDCVVNVMYDKPGHPAFGQHAFTRKRYNRLKYIFHPGYASIYSDFDAYWMARVEGRLVHVEGLVIEHHHPHFKSSVPWDRTYAHENDDARKIMGRALFQKRWPGAEEVINAESSAAFAKQLKQVWWYSLPERCIYDISYDVSMRLMEYNTKAGFHPIYGVYGRTDVTRQTCAVRFRQTAQNPTDTLVMLDIDHDHPVNIVELLASRDVPVVAALTFCRKPPYTCSSYRHNGDNRKLFPLTTFPPGLHRMHAIGTGAVAIQRKVFDQLAEAGHEWFFKMEYGPNWYMPGEDLYFCKLCEENNIPMYVDTTVESPHISYGFIDSNTANQYLADHPGELSALPL